MLLAQKPNTMDPGQTDRYEKSALLGIGVAAAIAVGASEGEWTLLTVPLGLTLLFVMLAFDAGDRKGFLEPLAFAAVYGLVLMLIFSGIFQPEVCTSSPCESDAGLREGAIWLGGTIFSLWSGPIARSLHRATSA